MKCLDLSHQHLKSVFKLLFLKHINNWIILPNCSDVVYLNSDLDVLTRPLNENPNFPRYVHTKSIEDIGVRNIVDKH